jgi:hypothetical protein
MGTVIATRSEILARCSRAATARLLELHIREDHPRREHRLERDDDNSADTSASAGDS